MTPPRAPHVAGVLLAAGSGRRFGGPKALADTGDGPWLVRSLEVLESLGERLVVLGAAADRVAALVSAGARVVRNPDYASGMGSSLRAGLAVLDDAVDAVVIMLVDLPDVRGDVVRRVVDAALVAAERGSASGGSPGGSPGGSFGGSFGGGVDGADGAQNGVIPGLRATLARATYDGVPGHPVLIGAEHFPGVMAAAAEDRGARDYLATHDVMTVECGDLAHGKDVDQQPSG